MNIPYRYNLYISYLYLILPIPGEAKAKAMPGRLYIHTRNNNNNKNKNLRELSQPQERFAPKFKRNQDRFFFLRSSSI